MGGGAEFSEPALHRSCLEFMNKSFEAKVGVEWQQFTHPHYVQCGSSAFIPGLTALDALFNCGPYAVELLPRKGKRQHADERIAA